MVRKSGVQPLLLDFGCGSAGLCIEFANRGFCVTGIDTSTGMIEVGRKRVQDSRIKLIHGDAYSLKQDGAFDGVVSCMVFQFIEDLRVPLQAISGSMKSGGVMSFTTFNPAYVHANRGIGSIFEGNEKEVCIRFDDVRLNVFLRDPSDYAEMMRNVGFQLLEQRLLPFSREFIETYLPHSDLLNTTFPEYLLMTFKKW